MAETETAVRWPSILEGSFRELAAAMLPVEIQSVRNEWDAKFNPDLAAEIAFRGNISGKFGLFLPWETAHALTNLFQGVEVPPDREEIRDVAQEVANLIAGGLKQRLREANGFSVEISVPTIQAEPLSEDLLHTGTEQYRVLFKTNVGAIGVRVLVEGRGKAK